ncbi:MAG: FAD-dependent monooxygenase [Sinobacteraceae bacterium]|nr:FAD-dependent monooxygenase [Nevskiaceae bacterium]
MKSGREATGALVVGAGPTGLMVSAEIQSGGLPTTLIERRQEEESNLTRAFAVHARTLEILDACGLADRLVTRGKTIDGFQPFGRINLDLSKLPSRFPFVLITPQYETERVLREYATKVGVEILRGTEFTALLQDADGVDVQLRSTRDGKVSTRRAAFVVGADGAHSKVRQSLSMPFPGHSSKISWLMLADVRLAKEPTQVIAANATGDDFVFIAPFGDGWYRVFAWNRQMRDPEGGSLSLDPVKEITRRAMGTDFGMHEPRWISRFHNDERQVPEYQRGRVFLAGDAAHVHSPAGGQGMNTGIQDAANLGWKLAAVGRGDAPAALLDTYQTERHPVGKRVVQLTERLVDLVTLRNPFLRATRNVVGGIATHLPPISERFAGAVSGVGISYTAPPGSHKLVGKRVSDLALDGGPHTPERLYELLRRRKFVVLCPVAELLSVTEVAKPWSRHLELAAARAKAEQSLVLVRPDGYVAWASSERASPRRDAMLKRALEQWCGKPTHPGEGDTVVGSRSPVYARRNSSTRTSRFSE